ncbi:MAG: ATP-dependent zinc protease [Candidatus Aenigmatarchaeota archaeon]|nr:MAG: ATP-dependent zinc protease [Candidatus Aenigmarchaeota archaeon]
MPKKTIGLVEKVRIYGNGSSVEAEALVDTGAKMTSIDIRLAGKAKLGPVVRMFKTRAPITKEVDHRPVVTVTIKVKGKKFTVEANLNDRSHMKYPVLLGRNLLYGNFVVDVSKSPKITRQ